MYIVLKKDEGYDEGLEVGGLSNVLKPLDVEGRRRRDTETGERRTMDDLQSQGRKAKIL